jgi:hypothetical protein
MTTPAQQVIASARSAVAVTPSDTTTNLGFQALYIGGSGAVTVDMIEGGTNITFPNVPVGFFPVAVKRVYATDTSATNIVGLNW